MSCLRGTRFPGLRITGHGGGPGWPSPALPQVHPHVLGWSPWDTEASLSLGQTTGVSGMGGLATGGTMVLPRACAPPTLWEGHWRLLSTWPSERHLQRGRAEQERGVGPAPCHVRGRPGSGSVNSPCFSRGWAPYHKAKQALSHPLAPTCRVSYRTNCGTGMRPLGLCVPPLPPEL